MGFFNFEEFVKNIESKDVNENNEYDFHFETVDAYINENNREDVDNLLYEYVCNYKDDTIDDDLTVEGLRDYIYDDNTLSEDMRNSLDKYIDICEESIEDTFEEICE